MTFCTLHGFYEPCPQCEGTPIVWEIPIVAYGKETGKLRISEGEATFDGEFHIASVPTSMPTTYRVVTVESPAPAAVIVPAEKPWPEPPDPALTERIAAIFPSVYEQLMQIPKWREAANQGLRLHNRAVAMSKDENVSYAEALERITKDKPSEV